MAHKDLGMAMMNKIKADLETMAIVDMPAKIVGRAIGMSMTPLPAAKRKRRFAKPEESFEEMEARDAAEDNQEEAAEN